MLNYTPPNKKRVGSLPTLLYCKVFSPCSSSNRFVSVTDNPFATVDALLAEEGEPLLTFVDFHAEATSEKLAMGYLLEGRVSAVWGTHTHVQTSDCQVLAGGTGYITDLGMTGPARSVLGIDPEQSIGKFLGDPPRRYASASGRSKLECALFTVDAETGRCVDAEALRIE